ncbi:MAG: hypothetical protein KAJ51_10025 [Thermoplasmata archaeon]|nr:hypothetical protein [Thermoplasmata archaeon]
MADIKSATQLAELQGFLDSLPAKPCPENPRTPDHCTVCKRLNQEVASRCNYSGLEIDAEKGLEPGEPEKVEFKPVTDEVETKQVVPPDSEEEFPMIEIVKPTTKPQKPVEMELLEDVAIEFEIMGEGDEPVEVGALEVEPFEGGEGDEGGEEGGTLQFEAVGDDEVVEVVEVVEIDEEQPSEVLFEPAGMGGDAVAMQPLSPASGPPTLTPMPATGPVPKRPKLRKGLKLKKRPLANKAPMKRQPIRDPVLARAPRVLSKSRAPLKLEPVEEQGFEAEPAPAYSTKRAPKAKIRPKAKLKVQPKAKQAPRIIKPKARLKSK